jgi:hypothetical protein
MGAFPVCVLVGAYSELCEDLSPYFRRKPTFILAKPACANSSRPRDYGYSFARLLGKGIMKSTEQLREIWRRDQGVYSFSRLPLSIPW